MAPLEKLAVFLVLLGFEKGKKLFAFMDTQELRHVVRAMEKVENLSPKVQEAVWAEVRQLGYKDALEPTEVMYVLRGLFNGSKICP